MQLKPTLSVTSQGIGNSLMVELRRGLVFMDHMFIYPALNSIHVKFDIYVHTGAHEFHKDLFQKAVKEEERYKIYKDFLSDTQNVLLP